MKLWTHTADIKEALTETTFNRFTERRGDDSYRFLQTGALSKVNLNPADSVYNNIIFIILKNLFSSCAFKSTTNTTSKLKTKIEMIS